MCKHAWYGDGLLFMRATQPWNLEPCNMVMNCACTETTACRCVNSSASNWTETQERQKRQTCPSHVEGQTWNTTKELEKSIPSLRSNSDSNTVLFTKRFRPVVTRVPAVVLSISRCSRLAVARAWLFAMNELTPEGTGTYSHFGPRRLRMSWLTRCCCIAVIACGTGLFHMARASSRLTSVQIDTTKQLWLWSLASCLPPRRRSHMLKTCANVFTPPVGYSGSLSAVNETCKKTKGSCTKKLSVHILQVLTAH